MSKEKIQEPDPKVIPMNPDAMNYLGWFMSDSQNLRSWGMSIFSVDSYIDSKQFIESKSALEIALTEIEDDVVKIREFLSQYK